MKTIRVDVKPDGERALKIVWNDEQDWGPPYSVPRSVVENATDQIREVLRELVQTAIDGKLAGAGRIVKDLARAGSFLHNALFGATEGEDLAERIRRYYRNDKPFRLRISTAASVFAPWGLIFPADEEEIEALPVPENITDIGPYDRFWCISRELATSYGVKMDAAGDFDSSKLGVMRVIHPETFALVRANVNTVSETGLLTWLDHAAPPITTAKDLRKVWNKEGGKTGLLYFYCHANATKLSLGELEQIESARLFETLSRTVREPNTPGCLLIINGCSTAVGDPKGDFMTAASQKGLCGFIGTETDVPDVFALRFSLALLDLLLREGLTIAEAMLRLYRSHFPLSLLYGLYAHPEFRMPKEGMPQPEQLQNLSLGMVGTGRLEWHDAR